MKAQAKMTVALERLKRSGAANLAGVGESVFELKLDWGPGYRLYFGKDGERVVILLCGGTKKRQSQAIAKAKRDFDQRQVIATTLAVYEELLERKGRAQR